MQEKKYRNKLIEAANTVNKFRLIPFLDRFGRPLSVIPHKNGATTACLLPIHTFITGPQPFPVGHHLGIRHSVVLCFPRATLPDLHR